MPVTVLSPAFDQSVTALADHPVITEMATDLLAATPDQLATLMSATGDPNTRFIALANDRFAERTGDHAPFLGTVARAVAARLAELRAAEDHTSRTQGPEPR
ncbi:hypothetical protein ACFC07_22320 [Streptomyces sp. NPDC056099]|uniref:hypothetical protein n=1 Tax=unclassified Streptomyces TaxID=2593676 RepID=UPI0035E1D246